MSRNIYIYLLLITLPFFILLPYTLQYLEVGNDFELYFFTYKKYIFELLKNGHLPLWSPVEATGTSLIFNPLAQFFYAPSWIFYLICFLFGEITKYYFLIYTILAISIFNLGFFFYFRTLNIDYKIALTTIFITSLSLKVTELLRFPNAIHCFAWFPWIMYGINLAVIDFNYRKSFIVIFFSCLMLLTAGYPYYIFYALILFSFYFILLLIKPFKTIIFYDFKNYISSNKIFFLRCLVPSFFSLLVASPWLFKVSQLVSITYGRNTPDISFSLNLSSNIYDQIGSWFYPPFSFAEGWFYFGAISVLIIILASLNNIFFIKGINSLKIFFYFLIFLLIFSYQISNPIDSLIFSTIWNNLDFIQNFRQWVRFNIILVPIISIVLAYSIIEFLKILNNNNRYVKKIIILSTLLILLILALQFNFIYFSKYQNIFWETWQMKRILFAQQQLALPFSFIINLYDNFIYTIYFFISFIILICSLKLNFFKKKINENKNIFLYLISIIAFSELFFLTNVQWAIPYNYYDKGFEKIDLRPNYNSPNNDALSDLTNAFKSSSVSTEKSNNNRYEGNTYYRHNKKFNINHINNWGNHKHVEIFKNYFNLNGNFKENVSLEIKNDIKLFFALDHEAKRVFYSKKINYENIFEFIKDSKSNEINENFSFDIIHYDGDNLVLEVYADTSGWISFIDTWDSNWIVKINNNKKKINKLLGAYKSVMINPGISKVEFSYKPFNFNFSKN